MSKVDKEGVRDMLHAQLESVLPHLLPHGKFNGHYFDVGSVNGEGGESLRVYLSGEDRGMWKDYAVDEKHKDIFALWMEVKDVSFTEALKQAKQFLGMADGGKQKPRRTIKYKYYDADEKLHMEVHRLEFAGGKKDFRLYDAKAKSYKSPKTRVLYCLPSIMDAGHVIVAEGEKAADALRQKNYTATTVAGGANAPIDKTDWTPLIGKKITIWPDADEPGLNYATRLARYLFKIGVKDVAVLQLPKDKDKGWDAADALEEGLDFEALLKQSAPAAPQSFLKVYRGGEIFTCTKQPPADLISGGLLTPRSVMLVAGPPKSMKSYFVQWILANAAIGRGFLNFQAARPLRAFMLQAEMDYWLIRKRLQRMSFLRGYEKMLNQNLCISDRFNAVMNDETLEELIDIIRAEFPDAPPDVIVLDPFANMFDGDNENDNAQIIRFYKTRVEHIRREVNPEAAVIIVHHSNKINRQSLMEDPFNAIRGGSAHRGYYTTGIFISKIEEELDDRRVFFDCRSGPSPLPMTINFDDDTGGFRNVTVESRIAGERQGVKNDAERNRKDQAILDIIREQALLGEIFETNSFSEKFENEAALGSWSSISRRINVLATKGHIKYFKSIEGKPLKLSGRSNGCLCVQNMLYNTKQEIADPQTGEIIDRIIEIKPTHYRDRSGTAMPVEDPEQWIIKKYKKGAKK